MQHKFTPTTHLKRAALTLLALVLTCAAAWADSITYIDENGQTQTVNAIPYPSDSRLGNNWYYVSGTINCSDYELYLMVENGTHNLILCDGATLTIHRIQQYSESFARLSVYGQSGGTGKLNVGNGEAVNAIYNCELIVNGGQVTLFGGVNQGGGTNHNVVFNGGNLTATGKQYGIDGNTTINASSGWIKASKYGGSVTIAEGKYMKDETGRCYTGTLTDAEKAAAAGKTLQPATQTEYLNYYMFGGGNGSQNSPYVISSTEGWNFFCDCLNDNDTWNRFSGKYVKLGANISVTQSAGSDDHRFMGTFDGDGKTLTFNYGSVGTPSSDDYIAPFSYTDGATITALHVSGTIYTQHTHSSGIIGLCYGTTTVSNCRSSINIVSSINGDGTHSGLIACTWTGSTTNITGCLFDGSIQSASGYATDQCGGFVGWKNGTVNVTNSLLTADLSTIGVGTGSYPSCTFVRQNTGVTFTNCYYITALGTPQGTQRRTVSAGQNVTTCTASPVGNSTPTYDVSGITAYNKGLVRDGNFYFGNTDVVNLTLAHAEVPEGYIFHGYTASAGTLTGNETDGYSLTMPNDNVTINASIVIDNTVTVTVASVANGTITATPTSAQPGDIITLTATPDAGYALDHWVVYKTDDVNTTVTVSNNSFTMPDYDVTVSAIMTVLSSITLYDGTSTNEKIPIYSYYADYGTRSQFIIPASALEALQNSTLDKLTFYYSTGGTLDEGFTVYMKEVNYTTFPDNTMEDWNSMTDVYTGTVTISNNQMEIDLSGFWYTGGNLMIGFQVTTWGNSCPRIYWYGEDQSNTTAMSNYANSSHVWYTTDSSISEEKFLPKVTIDYTPGENPSCPPPTGLEVDNMVATWDAGTASMWNLRYKKTSQGESEWTTEYNLDEASYPFGLLDPMTSYEVQVEAVCGDETSGWTNSASFFTPCVVNSLPYTYGFEDETDYNDCWTNYNLETCEYNNSMGGGIYNNPNSSYARTGSYFFAFSSLCGEEDPQYLISPQLEGVANGVHVEFYYRNAYTPAPETFQVGYSTTDNNVSSFTWVDSGTCTNYEEYQHFVGNYMANVKYVAVKYTSSDSYYLFLDDFLIEEAPNCLEPTNVLASNETTTSATISWTAGGSETEWELYYTSNLSDVPTASTTPSISGITTNSRNLTDLTAATTYHVYVRAVCSSTEKGAWSNPGTFNTECYEMNLPFSYGFEDGALSVCWTPIIENPVYMGISVATTASYAGTYHLDLDRRTSNGTQIIVLPEVVSTQALSNYEVSFYARLYAAASNQTTTNRQLAVGVMTDPDDPSTFVQVGSDVTPTDSYAQYTFDLSSYTGNGHYIAIKHTSSSNGHTFIDNLEVTALPCPLPAGLNATPTATTASLSWTGDQSYYNVRYRSYVQVESFEEGFEGGSMPSGWDNSVYTGTSWNVGTGTGHTNTDIAATITSATGSYNAYYYDPYKIYSNSAYLILPALDLSNASVATLTFNYVNPAWAGGYYSLTVYYRVNGGSWNQLDQYTTAQDTWTEKTVPLTGLDSNYEVAFYVTYYNNDFGHGVGIDDVKIEYTTTDITSGTWENMTNQASPLNITGLTPNTDYLWQVQGIDGNCPGDDEGNTGWSEMGTFTTLAGIDLTVTGYGESTESDHWVFISSPVAADIAPTAVVNLMAETAEDYDLYRFNQAPSLINNAYKEWENYKAHAEGFVLENGKGYLYASKDDKTLVFAGEFKAATEPVEVPLAYSTDNPNENMRGWNLVGNPFAVSATSSLPYYRMNDEGSALKTETETSTVAAMEGVFVQATGNDQTVTFTAQTRGGEQSAVAALNIMVGPSTPSTGSGTAGTSIFDNAILRFDGGQTLEKFSFRDGSTKLYIPQNGKEYAIINAEAQTGEIPVNFKAEKNGSYTISVNVDNVEMAYLHLIDNMTGNDIDLLHPNTLIAGEDPQSPTPMYTFQAKTTDYASRFRLVFSVEDVPSTGSASFAFYSNGNWIISNPSTGSGSATLQVIDVNGRILSSEEINGSVSKAIHATPGVYVMRLINGDNIMVQKIVVR